MSDAEHLKGIKLRIRHTMLPVLDLERSIAFYTQHLGMTLMRQRVNERRKIAVAMVGYGNEDADPAIELIQDIGDNPPATLYRWYGHVAIAVTELHRICAHLERAGVRFTQKAGPVAPGRKDQVAFLVDPDGYEIELTEHMSGNPAIPS